MIFYSTHPSQNLLRNPEPRAVSDVTNRSYYLFVVQHTNRRPTLSDFDCGHRDSTMTSPLELNYKMFPEYGVMTRYYRPTVTGRKGKKSDRPQFTPQAWSCHHRSPTIAEKLWDLFQTRNGKLCLKIFLKPIWNIIICFFIATQLIHGHILVLIAAAMMGLRSFWQSETGKGKIEMSKEKQNLIRIRKFQSKELFL